MAQAAAAKQYQGVPIKLLERWGKLAAVAMSETASPQERETAYKKLQELHAENPSIEAAWALYDQMLNARLARERRETGAPPRSAQEERARAQEGMPNGASPFEGMPYATELVEKIDFGTGFVAGFQKSAALKLAKAFDARRRAIEIEWNDLTPEQAVERLAEWKDPRKIPAPLRPFLEPLMKGIIPGFDGDPDVEIVEPPAKGGGRHRRNKKRARDSERDKSNGSKSERRDKARERSRERKLEYLEMGKLKDLLRDDKVTAVEVSVEEDRDKDPLLCINLEIAPETWLKAKSDPEEFMRFLLEATAEAEEELEEDYDVDMELGEPDDDDDDDDSSSGDDPSEG